MDEESPTTVSGGKLESMFEQLCVNEGERAGCRCAALAKALALLASRGHSMAVPTVFISD